MNRQLRHTNTVRWDFLAGVLPNGINPTDIDLAFERRGHFLFMEGKRCGQQIPRGQQIFFERLAQLPNVTVVRFEGQPPDEVTAYGRWGRELKPHTTAECREAVAKWYQKVEREGKA